MEGQRPIIVKRIKKGSAGHSGAWKVAFADFATAMMAFFLVLWLMASATPEQKLAIEGYFRDPVGFTEGGSASPIDLGGSPQVSILNSSSTSQTTQSVTSDQVETLAEQMELQKMEILLQQLAQRIDESPRLREFKDQLVLDITDEGLRIQIVDKSQRPMFDIGSSKLKPYSEEILFELVEPLSSVPNRISLSGHTDAMPYSGSEDSYSNWELSADRANAARRALLLGGLAPDRIARVVGLASSVLFDQKDPYNPVNRRISIIVLNKKTDQEMRAAESGVMPPAANNPAPDLVNKLNKAIERIQPVHPKELVW